MQERIVDLVAIQKLLTKDHIPLTGFQTSRLYLIFALWILIFEYFVLFKGLTARRISKSNSRRIAFLFVSFSFCCPHHQHCCRNYSTQRNKKGERLSFHCWVMLGIREKFLNMYFFHSYTWQWSSPLRHSRRHPWKSRKPSQIPLSRRKPKKEIRISFAHLHKFDSH